MAIKEIKREWNPCQLAYVKTFLLHTEEDLKHMPRCSVGSRATVSETDNEYVKTSDGWMLLCDCDEDGGQGAGGGAQPDWNQNDPAAADYVKNRTHYKAVETETLFDGTVTTGGTMNTKWNETQNEPISFYPVAGNSYRVTIDGVSYDCVANGGDTPYIGDYYLWMGYSSDEHEYPFVYGDGWFGTPEAGTYAVTITETKQVYYQLDTAYLPDSVLLGRRENKSEVFNNYIANVASGECSHAEGHFSTASGYVSHAEGSNTEASGECSHAEGRQTTASGIASHAEGDMATASGYDSHAEGEYTEASGRDSHAEGYGTIAASRYQHVQGRCNIEDSDYVYAHIVGNGNSTSQRSNAHTLDWDGNAWYAGTVEGTGFIIPSSTEGSTKRFLVTVDDSGTPTITDTSDSSNSWTSKSLPTVTADNNGAFLRVVDGAWAAAAIANAEEASF